MDRHEAVLRELNLYPLWVQREPAAQGAVERHATVAVEDKAQVVAAQPEHVRDTVIVSEPAKLESHDPVAFNWPELKKSVAACQACALRAGCTQTVFGVGDEKADWLFVGEAPGEEEDVRGEPFVGQAGKLLDNMLMAIKLKRGNNVYIANVIKCRPANDRQPHVGEIVRCLPYLERQIALIQPKVIVALGKVASNALLRRADAEGVGHPSAFPLREPGKEATLASLRGTLHDYHGIPLIVTYHPAYLLRSPSEKAKAWQDLCAAQKIMQQSN